MTPSRVARRSRSGRWPENADHAASDRCVPTTRPPDRRPARGWQMLRRPVNRGGLSQGGLGIVPAWQPLLYARRREEDQIVTGPM